VVEEFLVARDVGYRYAVRRGVEPVQVLRRFSVSLTEGEFFCLLGPSGCGKTTVLNLMAGFLEPAEGMLTSRPADPGPGSTALSCFRAMMPCSTGCARSTTWHSACECGMSRIAVRGRSRSSPRASRRPGDKYPGELSGRHEAACKSPVLASDPKIC
jgi:NitT/TauT family transport system ATP-binding protein